MDMRRYLLRKRQALVMGANRFFLPSGMSADSCLAAYQFKGVGTEAASLLDLSGNGYDLTKNAGNSYTPTWDTSTGWTFHAATGQNGEGNLDNTDLNTQNIKCAIVRYTDLTQNNRGYLVTAGGSGGTAFLYAATTIYEKWTEDGEIVAEVKNYKSPGYGVTKYSNYNSVGQVEYASDENKRTAAVVGANFGVSGTLYIDGVLTASEKPNSGNHLAYLDYGTARTFGNVHTNKSDLNNATHAGKVIVAAAFYSVALTADQHAWVAEQMLLI